MQQILCLILLYNPFTTEVKKQVIVVCSKECIHCPKLDGEETKALQKVGWNVGTHTDCDFKFIDLKDYPNYIVDYKIDVTPTYLLFVNNKPILKRKGKLTAREMSLILIEEEKDLNNIKESLKDFYDIDLPNVPPETVLKIYRAIQK